MNLPVPDPLHKPQFLEEVRRALRVRHYSIRTETSDLDWMKRSSFSMESGIRTTWVKPR
jgi:hypothetical protein